VAAEPLARRPLHQASMDAINKITEAGTLMVNLNFFPTCNVSVNMVCTLCRWRRRRLLKVGVICIAPRTRRLLSACLGWL
jgi:hypothetical protein